VRYLFHVRGGGPEYDDEVGRKFSSLGAARDYAAIIASELALDDNWELCDR
jgi:hypothetical protein